MANRISQLLAGKVPGIEEDIRFSYAEDSFRLWWGERGNPETTLVISFDQLQTLNDEEIKQIIRSSAAGR
jgi:hypothetical protein